MSDLLFTNIPVPYRTDLYRSLAERTGLRVCFGRQMPLQDYLEAERPRVVFAPEFSQVTLEALRLRKRYGYKVVSFCDDSLDMIRGNDFGWKHTLARRVVPRFLDGIILHSPGVCEWYRERFGKGFFMPIISDERRVRPDLERVLPVSERMRPGRKPVVAFVGRLVGLKNVPILVRAFEPLHDRAQLVIIGDGEERASLERLAPHALFTGYLDADELLAWYNLIDVLALPSTQEAYGAVTGEALMAGAKVIVSEKAGSSDLVRDGENGFVVDPMDADAMTANLYKLLEGVPMGRPLALRENLLPYRFENCIEDLIRNITSL